MISEIFPLTKKLPREGATFYKSCCGFVHSRNRNHLFPVEDIHKFAVLIQDQHFLS